MSIIKSSRLIKSLSGCTRALSSKAVASSKVVDEMDKFQLPKRYAGSEKSVWVEYIALAQEHNPLNLGQGFPDFGAPEHVINSLVKAASSENVLLHQYTRGFGHMRLVKAISTLFSRLIKREINPLTEVLVTSGAYEALYCSIVGHVDEGDEVIIIEPFFDCYEPMVRTAGGVPKFIPLRFKAKPGKEASSGDWVLDTDELTSLFSSKTKAIILNTPNNPLGKVFTREELEIVANLCKKWNVLCISDEVYEWMVYENHEHIRIATLPGMWERTITIGSAGKTFSVTGWKTGWAYGPANLMTNLQMVHQNCVYTCPTILQEAIAMGFETELKLLDKAECYFYSLPRELKLKRDYMIKFLRDAGMKPTVPDGGYFIIADWSALESKVDLSTETDKYKDYRFTKWMTKNIGLQGIPVTAFYSEPNKHLAENFVRYCFIKKDERLQEAEKILMNWKSA